MTVLAEDDGAAEALEAAVRAGYAARRAEIEAAPLPENLGALLDACCREDPDRTAWVFFESGEAPTLREVHDSVTRLAQSLHRLGVAKGDHVAVMLPNVAAFPTTWLALAWLGAVMVPVNVRYTAHELLYVLEDSRASLLVVDASLADVVAGLPHRPARLGDDRIVVRGGDGERSWEALERSGTPGFAPPGPVGRDDLMNIQYTSGTTGFPKGCMLTHRYWLTIGKVAAHRDPLELKNILVAQPFFYMDPQWLTLMALYQKGTTFVAARPSASRFMDWVRRYDIHFCLFPEPVYALPPTAADADNRLRRANVYGLRREIHADLVRRFGVAARECFGMTEVGSALYMPVEAAHMTGSGSCGLPSPFRRCRIVDPEGRDVPQGEIGELIIAGPGILQGYYDKPEANRASFFGEWFRTGDLFRQDERGYFYIVGRVKDMVRRSGENIAAREVEAALMGIEGVREAAVIGVPDDLRKEEVKAYVVLDDGLSPETLTPAAILDAAARRLAPFKVPRYLEYVEDLPRTPSMKVKKDALKGAKPDLRQGSWDRVDGVRR